MSWIILRLFGFLCVRDAGHRGNKITEGMRRNFSENLLNTYLINSFQIKSCVQTSSLKGFCNSFLNGEHLSWATTTYDCSLNITRLRMREAGIPLALNTNMVEELNSELPRKKYIPTIAQNETWTQRLLVAKQVHRRLGHAVAVSFWLFVNWRQTLLFEKNFPAKLHLPLNRSVFKKTENVNVKWRSRQNTQARALSSLSNTSVLPSSYFCRPVAKTHY